MNILISRYVKWVSAVAVVAMLFAACSKDEDPGQLSCDAEALFFESLGSTKTMGLSTSGLTSIKISAQPAGWKAEVDLAKSIVTVTAPTELGGKDAAVRSGKITMIAYTHENYTVVSSFHVTLTEKEELMARQSNCIILSNPYTEYTLDATRGGESSALIPTADVKIIWQTVSGLIKYLDYKSGVVSFYVDAQKDKMPEGNALLGAYDDAGNLLTTWHLWLVDAADVAEQTYANGRTFMSLNLGATSITNKTETEILDSFGMFYQWGRKVPFVGPYAYNAAEGTDHYMYNEAANRMLISYEKSTPEIGTEAYAAVNPLTFILGVEESQFDWIYSAHSDALWSETKSGNDPCPKGWRVPSKSDFAGLQIMDKGAGTERQFGWTMTDGSVSAYYPAAGFRTYLTGRIQNVYNPLEGVDVPKPWTGYYWTNGVDGAHSSALFFWLDASDVQKSGVETSTPYSRANGMQVRCVKE